MAKNIMIQGTMSNVGKSLLCAALCRVLRQDGYRCAPFKSQNMALNSGVTWDGLEMGRAQILQAQAAGLEPDVRMNPILLKPAGDTRSQVIVNGEVAGTYDAREYFAMKKRLVPDILHAYHSLASENDVIVIEGAGSPAEINLKQDDIVNMGLAGMVDTPVLLVGDIDPGGVFAQLYGTVMLLEAQERDRIKGLVINKFRGDISLLEPGIGMLEEKLGIPVAGVLPWMDLDLEEEDSMSPDLRLRAHDRPLDIAVIRFPRISNFTDMDPLSSHPLLGVRYVHSEREFGAPDMVILPGTKSTVSDLGWLRRSGLADRIVAEAGSGTCILGICGGYQMLGETICDPEGVEGEGSTSGNVPSGERGLLQVQGLGLLPVRTVFHREKTRRRVSGTIREGYLAGAYVYGYEIHMGEMDRSVCDEDMSSNAEGTGNDVSSSSLVCARGNVCGTYLHGIFDSGRAVEKLAGHLAGAKGLPQPEYRCTDRALQRERQLDELAKTFRCHVDMPYIYGMIGLTV